MTHVYTSNVRGRLGSQCRILGRCTHGFRIEFEDGTITHASPSSVRRIKQ